MTSSNEHARIYLRMSLHCLEGLLARETNCAPKQLRPKPIAAGGHCARISLDPNIIGPEARYAPVPNAGKAQLTVAPRVCKNSFLALRVGPVAQLSGRVMDARSCDTRWNLSLVKNS